MKSRFLHKFFTKITNLQRRKEVDYTADTLQLYAEIKKKCLYQVFNFNHLDEKII